MSHNKDYKKELGKMHKPIFNEVRKCPRCGGRLVALPPDRAWCEHGTCDYGEMHLIGDGVLASFDNDKKLLNVKEDVNTLDSLEGGLYLIRLRDVGGKLLNLVTQVHPDKLYSDGSGPRARFEIMGSDEVFDSKKFLWEHNYSNYKVEEIKKLLHHTELTWYD